jgi:hypothetical protein
MRNNRSVSGAIVSRSTLVINAAIEGTGCEARHCHDDDFELANRRQMGGSQGFVRYLNRGRVELSSAATY